MATVAGRSTQALGIMSAGFSGPLYVHFGQAYVLPNDSSGVDLDESFRGQCNGLLGAAIPGRLFLITGLHTGHVNFALEVLDKLPPIESIWEEVVEVPFAVDVPVALEQWDGQRIPFDIAPGAYRARYCARNMGLGDEAGDQNLVESYFLQFWPSLPAPDAILRQTREVAQYWHRTAQNLRVVHDA